MEQIRQYLKELNCEEGESSWFGGEFIDRYYLGDMVIINSNSRYRRQVKTRSNQIDWMTLSDLKKIIELQNEITSRIEG